MTPETKIKITILKEILENFDEYPDGLESPNFDNEEECLKAYNFLDNAGYVQDYNYEFREGEEETDIPCGLSRNYELKSVASKMFDGSWVGWTYVYGGGKYGNPEEIEWMSDAYDLDITEEEKIVMVKTFKKK